MKKKHRDITVDGVQYGWTVKDNVDGDGGHMLVIWKDKKIIHEKFMCGLTITPGLVKRVIESIGMEDPWEHIIPDLQEHRVLKEIVVFDNQMRKDKGYNPRWNAIIESNTNDGTRLLAARFDITGLSDFDFPAEDAIGIQRVFTRDKIKLPNHPVNIERITFIINNEEVEFVRCDG